MKFFDHKLDSKSYFYAGLIAEQPFFSKVRHSGGGLYTQLGGTESMPLMSLFGKDMTYMGTVDFNSQLNQIQVPVSVKYHFIPNFSASAGMNFGFNISEKLKLTESSTVVLLRIITELKSSIFFRFLEQNIKSTTGFLQMSVSF